MSPTKKLIYVPANCLTGATIANFAQETLANRSVCFSVCRIRFLRGQDKRSAIGRSVMVGFAGLDERRFARGCGAYVTLSNDFNTSSAIGHLEPQS